MPTHLFVYGTLMCGESRHRHLAGAEYIADVQTRPIYRMYNCGDYPALVESEEGRTIAGELWQVSEETLRVLDDVEGIDEGLYARQKVELLPPFNNLAAETYVYRQSIDGLPEINGDWRRR